MTPHLPTSAHGVLLALLTSLLVAVGGSPASAADRDCGHFRSQRSAQIFFIKHGGPRHDPHALDAEGDGIACESNDAPYYFGKKLPPITSSVRLAVSPGVGIAGERLGLRVRVAPRMKRAVVVQRKVSSGWDKVASGTTSGRGRFSYATRIRASATTYRAVLARKEVGAKRYSGDLSSERRVVTRQQSVVLEMPNGALTEKVVRPVATASPARPGREVELQRRTSGGWRSVDVGVESRVGVVDFRFRTRRHGVFTYRAVVLADGGAAAVRSERQRLKVTAPVPDDTEPPAVPTGLVAVPGDGQVELSWEPVTDSDRESYVVHQRSSAGGWTEVARTVAETTVVAGLTNGLTYRFAVSAVDTSGNPSDRSGTVWATPVAPDTTPPPVPRELTATAGDHQVVLSWQAVWASDLAHYLVHVRESGSAAWSDLDHAAGPGHTVTGLRNSTSYEFAVSAVDQLGNESALSTVVVATPVAPPLLAPTDLTALPGDAQVHLSWTAGSDTRVIGYRIDVREAVGGWTPAPDGVTTGSDGTVAGLVNGVDYSFTVVALARDGSESDRSEVVTATPEPAGP